MGMRSRGLTPQVHVTKISFKSIAESDLHMPANIEPLPPPDDAKGKPDGSKAQDRHQLSTLEAEAFRSLYFEQGKNLREVGYILGVSGTAILKWFRRRRAEFPGSLRSRFKRSQYKFNEQLFDSWTPEMAYVLGVLATDGNVGKHRVTLTSTDLELVEKIRSLIGSNHEIRERPVRGWSRKTQYSLSVSSLKFVTVLRRLGVTARKSLTMRFPEIPREFVRHFLRGCWDGDGSLYIEKRSNRLRASIVSGSKDFMEGIAGSLSNAGFRQRMWREYRKHRYLMGSDKLRVYTLHRGRTRAYYIRLTGKSALQFGKFIYESVPESMYLKRKYDVFLSASNRDPANAAG